MQRQDGKETRNENPSNKENKRANAQCDEKVHLWILNCRAQQGRMEGEERWISLS